MQRRRTLLLGITAGIAFLTGCTNSGSSSGDPSTDGDDDTPIEADPEDLLLSTSAASDVLGGDWNAGDPHDQSSITRGTDATAGYAPDVDDDSGPDGWITAGVWVFETVDAAREEYDGHGYHTGFAFEDAEIAVESIAGTVDRSKGLVLFRDANAVGAVARTAPDKSEDELVTVSLRLGAAMHRPWRDG